MNKPKISILLPTHNRPDLFTRCINSILYANEIYHMDIEIIVNNDTCDIQEIESNMIRYIYYSSNNLSKIYEKLFVEARGEFIYYLEDDDYMHEYFFKKLDLSKDINYMNYKRFDLAPINYITHMKNFEIEKINQDFQLSQILFKKSLLDIWEFPQDNNLHNDWKIFDTIRDRGDIHIIKHMMFTQTIDGNDNISFPKLNKDNRWIS